MPEQPTMGTEQTKKEPLAFGQEQDIGRRSNIEDFLQVEHTATAAGTPLTLAIIADGVGGSNHGEVAAEMTVETVFAEVEASPLDNPENIPALLKQALEKANQAVYAQGRKNKAMRGMGTTATVAAIHEHKLYLANVGDSRAYLARDDQVVQLTQDHTWAYEMTRLGRLTAEEAAKHPKAEELVRSIGYEPEVDVDLGLYRNGDETEETAFQNQGLPLQANDRLALCSDGLIKVRHDGLGQYVEEAEIEKLVRRYEPQKAAEALVKTAVNRRADDNVSVIVLEMPGSKRARYIPPPLAYGGIAAVLLVLAIALFSVLGSSEAAAEDTAVPTQAVAAGVSEGDTAVAAADTPTHTAVVNADAVVTVIKSAPGSRWEAGGKEGNISDGQPLPLPAEGASLTILGGNGVMALALPDGSRLFLDRGTEVKVESVAGSYGATETRIIINAGRLALATSGKSATVTNPHGAKAQTTNGILGVAHSDEPFKFEASCLVGHCRLEGDLGGRIELAEGQASWVGGSGKPNDPEPARYELYNPLAPNLVPTATATPTATDTPTPTQTNTPTRKPIFAPTPTATPEATPVISEPPTPTQKPDPPPPPQPTAKPNPTAPPDNED